MSATTAAPIQSPPHPLSPHPGTDKKLGHRKVVNGKTVYKQTLSRSIMAGIQLGVGHSVGSITPKERRDLLMADFEEIECVDFPACGGSVTPAHSHPDFKFKSYAPRAFRHFREAYGIRAENFMLSICDKSLRELTNPGASGSIFYITEDDMFVIKTVQKKEAKFLRQLLPGYYMNLMQNKKTLIPKFFGLYNLQNNVGRNIRFVVMNNLLPSTLHFDQRFDLKGSTFQRCASSREKLRTNPTLKDLDFLEIYPEGLLLSKSSRDWLMQTLKRDCLVLESFQIMDYSLLVGIHKMDAITPASSQTNTPTSSLSGLPVTSSQCADAEVVGGNNAGVLAGRGFFCVEGGNISSSDNFGGILAQTSQGEPIMIFLGLIDILQQYKLKKKLEHAWKSIWFDGSTVSVINPQFYARRFREFIMDRIFRGSSEASDRIPVNPLTKRPKSVISYIRKKEEQEGKMNRDAICAPVDENQSLSHYKQKEITHSAVIHGLVGLGGSLEAS